MPVITLTPTNVIVSENGQVEFEFVWNGNTYSQAYSVYQNMIDASVTDIATVEEAARILLGAWATVDPTLADPNDVLGKDFHVHVGQDLQGNGNADLHLLWKRGGPV